MKDFDRLEQRVKAVEQTVVDGDAELEDLAEVATLAEDVERLEGKLDGIEERVADLEASIRAVEGYVGNVESINESVEGQAASAIAAVDRLEKQVQTLESTVQQLAATGATADVSAQTEQERRRSQAAPTVTTGSPTATTAQTASGEDATDRNHNGTGDLAAPTGESPGLGGNGRESEDDVTEADQERVEASIARASVDDADEEATDEGLLSWVRSSL